MEKLLLLFFNSMIWQKRWFHFAVLLGLGLIWGSSFILIKIGLKSFSNDQAAAIRMLLASLALLPISLRNIKLISRKDIPALLYSGFLGSFIPAFLFTKAQTQIDSAVAGILNSLTPVFTMVAGAVIFNFRFKAWQVSGLLLGLIGAAGLIVGGKDFNLGSINFYAMLIVLATILYALNINIVKIYLTHLTGVQITSLAFMFIWPVALIYLTTTDFAPVFHNPDWPVHFGALAVLGIIGTSAALMMMNSLIRYVSPVFASSVTYIIPAFAIMWGFIDGEKITLHHLGNMAIILLGVYLINRKKVQKVN
jgi:drug/metabolite transporter (DMT)-like permease